MADEWFGVLGPLTVSIDGTDRTPQPAKVQSLLALLVLNVGSVVPTSDIVTELWGDEAPGTPIAALYVYVSQLRQLLNPSVPVRHADQLVQTERQGYKLCVEPGRSDVAQFREKAAQGKLSLDNGDTADAVARLTDALAMWRGPALAGVDSWGRGLHQHAVALDEHRLAVREYLLDAELAQGNHADALPELTRLTRLHPLREQRAAQLMLALYRSGRQADALAVFRRTRDTLITELGVEPGPELREMQHAILVGGVPALEETTYAGPGPGACDGVDTPAQLLSTIPDFTGREPVLAAVLDLVAADPAAVAPPLCEITGPGGAGKTTLALHAAHMLRAEFPDGQLFGAMGGSSEHPADPGEVLRTFLVALGLDSRLVPDLLEERSRLLRTRLTGRRVLIVLDDVAEESQVRPLLPGTPGCAVVITGRSRLIGLEGVTRVAVNTLEPAEARALLARMIGAERYSTDPGAGAEVARLCGHLPLAVRIAGARLSARPHRSISDFAEALADEPGRLDELVAGDLDVRASIGLSYRACTEPQQRALRLLSAMRWDDFPAWIVATLLDATVRAGTEVVEQLVDAQLLQAVGSDDVGQARYQLHDLVRIYADEHRDDDPEQVRNAAQLRLHTVLSTLLAQAEELVQPDGEPLLAIPAPRASPPRARPGADRPAELGELRAGHADPRAGTGARRRPVGPGRAARRTADPAARPGW